MIALDGKVAIVTGGASGIGLSAARELSRSGATTLIADIDFEAAQRAAEAIGRSGGIAEAVALDVGCTSSIARMFETVAGKFGKLNILFSHAGVQGPQGFGFSDEVFDELFRINVRSHFSIAAAAVPLMRASAPAASLIFTSSTAALRANTRVPLYAASKAAILSLMRSLAAEYGPEGIRSNAICPGPTETSFSRGIAAANADAEATYQGALATAGKRIPLGRVGQPEDAAALVAFLGSDRAAYLNGMVLPVDGGLSA